MSIERKEYQFSVPGIESARREILLLTEALLKLRKAEGGVGRGGSLPGSTSTRAGGGAGGSRAAADRGQRDAHIRAWKAQQKEKERADKSAAKTADKAARDEAKARQWAKREIDKAQKEKLKAADKAYKAEEKARKDFERNMAKHDRQAQQRAKAAAREQARIAREQKLRPSLTGMVGDRMRGIAGSMVSMAAGGLAAYAGLSTIVGGAIDIGQQATRDRLIQEKAARALAVSGGNRNAHGALLSEATSAALAVAGTKTEDVLAAQQRYVAMTGDLGTARGLGRTFATTARATGANEADIAATAATFSQKFGVKDERTMQSAMAMMVRQGQQGAFEMGDAAQYFSEMGAAGSRFGLDQGTEGIAQLGALAQIARSTTGNGAKASTATQAMLRQLVAKSDTIKGFNQGQEVVFADKGKTKTNNIVDVLAGTIGATKGNLGKAQQIFGEEGIAGVSAMITAYNQAQNALKKGASETEKRAAGEAAVRKMLNDQINVAGSWSDVMKDAAVNTGDASSQMTTAWQTIVSQVGSAILPSLTAFSSHASAVAAALKPFAESVGKAIEGLGEIATWAQRHGLIGKEEGPAADRLIAVSQRRKALEEKKKTEGYLGVGETRELNQLRTQEGELVSKIAADMGLQGDASAGRYRELKGGSFQRRGSKEKLGPVDEIGQLFGNYGFAGATTEGFNAYTRSESVKGPEVKRGSMDEYLHAFNPLSALDLLGSFAKQTNSVDSAQKLDTTNAQQQFAELANAAKAARDALAAVGSGGNGTRSPTSLPGTP